MWPPGERRHLRSDSSVHVSQTEHSVARLKTDVTERRAHHACGRDERHDSGPKGGGGARTYVVGQHSVDRGEATLACQAVLDVLRHRVVRVWIDAYSDDTDELPVMVVQAQDWLREEGRARGSGDPGMGIELDPSDDNSWDLVRTYASWSIHVELAADTDAYQAIASLHVCGYSVTAELTSDESVEVSHKLADIVPVAPLYEARERDEAEWATAREARLALLTRKVSVGIESAAGTTT